MNRRTALAATSSLLVVVAAGVAAAPSAAAYPIRDFGGPCVGGSAPVAIELLSSRYARYLSVDDLRAADANGNGSLCVARVADRPGRATLSMDAPVSFIDDSGA